MKKLICCLLAVVMLITAACAFAESSGRVEKSNAVKQFLKETDLNTKDIALQAQSGDAVSDLVIRVDGDNLHFVSRTNNVEDSHVQLTPKGVYLKADGAVTQLRFATVTKVLKDVTTQLDSMLEETMKSIPKEQLPTKSQIKKALKKLAVVASEVEAQEEADAATLSAAAMAFADKFKPEYVLDVKQDEGSVEINLRSDAFAIALAEAMDELMVNPDLAELVDRRAALTGGKTFAEYQQDWLLNRDATLEAISTVESSEAVDENGHWVSHFQIGEESEETKPLTYDTDAWIDAEGGWADVTVSLGFKDEDPFMVHKLAVKQDSYRENLTVGESVANVHVDFEDGQIYSAEVSVDGEDNSWLRMELGPDYLYMRGPKGGISSTVRETWTGKTRYEVFAETAEGQEASAIVDFYQDGDSLVCELNSSDSDEPAIFKLSRIDKVTVEDLSASENVTEITADKIETELESLLKKIVKVASK